MERSVGKRLLLGFALTAGAGGCGVGVSDPAPVPNAPAPYEVQRPSLPTSEQGRRSTAAPDVDVSWVTERDGQFAKFLRDQSGGLIKKAAVGIETKGELKIEISRAVEPDDTLGLTKSLMAGARKDFPDKPITLSLYDPDGAPILKARYRPGDGVHYQIVHGTGSASNDAPAAGAPARPQTGGTDPLARGGLTERDRAFAAWAEEHGKSMLRYVEADLERHGRLWFGVTRTVLPADVRPLTQSLLEGAHKEFPKTDLVATVFDPNGEKIGKAHLERNGEVRWEQ